MILIDANVLLYAYNPSSKNHPRSKAWLEDVLSKPNQVRLSWITIMAFLRIATDSRAFPRALSISEALHTVSEWLSLPNVRVLDPGDRHFSILNSVLSKARARGPLVMDGHLAALAIEHGATLCTSDRDFARFPGVRLLNPLDDSRAVSSAAQLNRL